MKPTAQQTGGFIRRYRISLPFLFASLMVAALFLSSSLLIWQGWRAAHRALIQSAEETTESMAVLADERVRHFISTASTTLNRLSHYPLKVGPGLENRSMPLMSFVNALTNTPLVSAIHVSYGDGDFMIVRQLKSAEERHNYGAPDDATYLIGVRTNGSRGAPTLERYFYNAHGDFISKYTVPDALLFDPRQRDWYQLAETSTGQHLSGPYQFAGDTQVGLTLSEKSSQGTAIVAMDLGLSALDERMSDQRPTPNAEYAIVSETGDIIANALPAREQSGPEGAPAMPAAPNVRFKALPVLKENKAPPGKVVPFDVENEPWFGVQIPLSAVGQRQLQLMVAMPDEDLTSSLRKDFIEQMIWGIIIIFFLMILSWYIGTRVGNSVTNVSQRTKWLSNFDFAPRPPVQSRILEVQQLGDALDGMSTAIRTFLATLQTIGNESSLDRMLDDVLHQTVAATGCTFGAVYLLNEQEDALELTAIARGQIATDAPSQFPHHRLPLEVLTPPHPMIGVYPRDIAQLAVPLSDRQNKPLGLLLLNHKADSTHTHGAFRAFATQLSGALSASIETRSLVLAQQRLFNGFVHLIADAIDAKSPYTGGHCRRVPELAIMMVDQMANEGRSPYGPYHLSAAERYEFRLGAWLHDCGKVTSPEHIIDKATKLEVIHNRIHEVRTRFEVLWRDEEIAHLRRVMDGGNGDDSLARRDAAHEQLRADFAFIARCNIGGEFMADADVTRLMEIARKQWTRNFSDRLGLSRGEEERLAGIAETPVPTTEDLLMDRPEHKLAWNAFRPPVEKGSPANVHGFDMPLPELAENRGELHNLTIRRGTLTDEDRFRVNDHVVQTYLMLHTLPWPSYLRRVPEIAATHHERMDGNGYPRRLDASQLTLEDRVMAIADVFEALTATDRPYKPAKTLSVSLDIMTDMATNGHLDPLLLRHFLNKRVWENYGEYFLQPEQTDAVDIESLIARLPRNAPPPPGLQ